MKNDMHLMLLEVRVENVSEYSPCFDLAIDTCTSLNSQKTYKWEDICGSLSWVVNANERITRAHI